MAVPGPRSPTGVRFAFPFAPSGRLVPVPRAAGSRSPKDPLYQADEQQQAQPHEGEFKEHADGGAQDRSEDSAKR